MKERVKFGMEMCLIHTGYVYVYLPGDIDDCEDTPCKNGGECTDVVNGFSCKCASGYTGKTCDG